MILPLIYTRTSTLDYRFVTSGSFENIPDKDAAVFTDIAVAMIAASNIQLECPTWVLVKQDGLVLWGIAVLNKILDGHCLDKSNRPVRGFFGIVMSGEDVGCGLPCDISFFQSLYRTFVVPIWDSCRDEDEIVAPVDLEGGNCIAISSDKNLTINTTSGNCRIFKNLDEPIELIREVYSTSGDCSVATNIHKISQGVEIGKSNFSFMNLAMDSDYESAHGTTTSNVNTSTDHTDMNTPDNTSLGTRMERLLESDFKRCETRDDFEKFLRRYGKYSTHKYVIETQKRLKALDVSEQLRREKEEKKKNELDKPTAPGAGGSGIPLKYKIMESALNVLVWILIVGAIGGFAYYKYQSKFSKEETENIVGHDYTKDLGIEEVSTSIEQSGSQESHTHEAQTFEEAEYESVEEAAEEVTEEPAKRYQPCPSCFNGRCPVCGGLGQVYSVFDGNEIVPMRLTDCGACNGSGECSVCEGSGQIEYFGW